VKFPHHSSNYLSMGKSFRVLPNLETDELLFLQAFNSFLEAYLKRGEFNTQAFCPFFGHLICWHKRLIIRTPVKVIWKNKKLTWKFYVMKLKEGQEKVETSYFGFMSYSQKEFEFVKHVVQMHIKSLLIIRLCLFRHKTFIVKHFQHLPMFSCSWKTRSTVIHPLIFRKWFTFF
jgi:hypothetical protein